MIPPWRYYEGVGTNLSQYTRINSFIACWRNYSFREEKKEKDPQNIWKRRTSLDSSIKKIGSNLVSNQETIAARWVIRTWGWKLVISKYPPRCPHSPRNPFDTVWKETSSKAELAGCPIPVSTYIPKGEGKRWSLLPVVQIPSSWQIILAKALMRLWGERWN